MEFVTHFQIRSRTRRRKKPKQPIRKQKGNYRGKHVSFHDFETTARYRGFNRLHWLHSVSDEVVQSSCWLLGWLTDAGWLTGSADLTIRLFSFHFMAFYRFIQVIGVFFRFVCAHKLCLPAAVIWNQDYSNIFTIFMGTL